MRLDIRALAITSGIIWALAIFLTGIVNLIWEGYGSVFLELIASLYPGYHAGRSLMDLLIGTLYGFFDGTVCGFLFGWVYNMLAAKNERLRESRLSH